MATNATAHLSTKAVGSVLQLWLATVPFFIVFVYFLYLAAVRPSLPIYNIPDNVDDDEVIEGIYAETGRIIELMDIVYVFLASLALWTALGVYLMVFVPKRRELMSQYLAPDRVEVLGDVIYGTQQCSRFSDYARAEYLHPSPADLTESPNDDGHAATWIVEKKVRTYHAYTRERVTFVTLPNLPLSGQPKADIEIDVATYTNESRNRIRDVLRLVLFWCLFSFFGPVFVLFQMGKIEDLDNGHGWKVFGLGVGVAIPLIALGGNWIRWTLHRRWLTGQGTIVHGTAAMKSPRPIEETGTDGESCIQSLCGTAEKDPAAADMQGSSTPYKLV